VVIVRWLVGDGSIVYKDQEIAEIESEKATLPLLALQSGKIKLLVTAGETVKVGTVACTIDTGFANEIQSSRIKDHITAENENKLKAGSPDGKDDRNAVETKSQQIKISPVAKKLMEENNLTTEQVITGLTRIHKEDVEKVISYQKNRLISGHQPVIPESRGTERIKMSQLRKKLSTRLVAVKNQTAMLTTFNEVDMSNIIAIRKKYQDEFVKIFGVKLGIMSFFTKAVVEALKIYADVNSMIDGEDIVYHKYMDIGIAVQTTKGLMVPVLRNAEHLSFSEIEKGISELAEKARNSRITIEELSGGTFSITNGGIFGSLLSTPILNPPQAGILGMHNIVERPVAINGRVEVRPMMYIALSYDHRLIDGRDSVGFLVKVKEFLETPAAMLFGNKNSNEILLGLE
jgi:2-oxoglutarate dehydrogenase E2 component (dihydrolipoamide succinyltransferase)